MTYCIIRSSPDGACILAQGLSRESAIQIADSKQVAADQRNPGWYSYAVREDRWAGRTIHRTVTCGAASNRAGRCEEVLS